MGINQPCKQEMIPFIQPREHPVPYPPESSQEGPMDIASVFARFAQESIILAEQANEPKQRETFTQLALLWATAAQQCSGAPGDAIYSKQPLGASVRFRTASTA